MTEPGAELAARAARCAQVRATTVALLDGLEPEDAQLQSEPDVSPPKWHLAHTTWFFETFVLAPFLPGHQPVDPRWAYAFNSYYEACGPRHARAARGLLSRPLLREVLAWREAVDEALLTLLSGPVDDEVLRRVELGLHHEQQHQELLVMDAKANAFAQPLRPTWRPRTLPRASAPPLAWCDHPGGLATVGHGGEGFAFDNEEPRHRVLLPPFALANRCVTNGEWAAFVADGGYRTPGPWLSDGWAWVQQQGIEAPRYWLRDGEGGWLEHTVHGTVPLDPDAPVVHVSGYEAEAFATWAEARLPTEQEWEAWGPREAEGEGRFLDDGLWHPAAATPGEGLRQRFGDVWTWTRSAYGPYPGYRPAPGALGEYNGKFMSSQWVLRGGCCATPRDHVRVSYRNFFHPHQRWAFSGVRLARDTP
ncbi:MAG: ergothioneine biosynthesis protein EgtB [Alphaproteobacteria bacterium]|nr:ergothioneine biosynthesis protein EgtB [Alphaproteobacteria bacterium]